MNTSQLPQFVYPTILRRGEVRFQIQSYVELSRAEAAAVVNHYCSTRTFTSKDDGKLITLVAPRDLSSVISKNDSGNDRL